MSSIRSSPESPRAGDRRGFTLIELLVALIVSGLLVAVIYQLMSGNGRYVRLQASREEVQENARAALDVIAGDLRTVPPSAIRSMGADSIRFYLPRGWGVLCDTIGAGSPAAWGIFPAGTLSTTDVFGKSYWGVAVEQTPDPLSHVDAWHFVAAPSQQTGGGSCARMQPTIDPGQQLVLGFGRPTGSSFVDSGTILPGTQMLLFEEMKYDVAPSGSSAVPGSWIRRMVGRSATGVNMQPMAGPVPRSGALRFTYFRADGSPAAHPAEVRRINLRVIAQSRAESGSGAHRGPDQVDTVSTDVYLRNVAD